MKTENEMEKIKILKRKISDKINGEAFVFSKFSKECPRAVFYFYDRLFLALAEVIESAPSLTTLDLSQDPYKPCIRGIVTLAETLKINQSITVLNLSGNGLNNEGLGILANALKTTSALTSLNLSFNSLEPEYYYDNKLGILSFDTSFYGQAIRALSKLIEKNTLTSLDLSYIAIDDEGADILASTLINNVTLTDLNLSNNRIGLMRHTPFNRTTQFFHTLAELFKKNSTLVSLDLSANIISPGCGNILAKALLLNKTLTSLMLNFNNHEQPLDLHSFETLLNINPTLIELDLGIYSTKILSLQNRNSRLESRMCLNWSLIAIAKRFIMANNENTLKYSIFPLLLEIIKLADISTTGASADISIPLINIDKYSKTKHFEHSYCITPAFNNKRKGNMIDEKTEAERVKIISKYEKMLENPKKTCSIQ